MIYVGVDPGAKGGVSAIDENNEILFAVPMSRENLVNFIKKTHNDIIEKNDAVIACFRLGSLLDTLKEFWKRLRFLINLFHHKHGKKCFRSFVKIKKNLSKHAKDYFRE